MGPRVRRRPLLGWSPGLPRRRGTARPAARRAVGRPAGRGRRRGHGGLRCRDVRAHAGGGPAAGEGSRREVHAGRGNRGRFPRTDATGLVGLLRRPSERAADAALPLLGARQRRAVRGDVAAELPALEKALPDVRVPLGVLVGARSPMPPEQAGLVSAEQVPGGWSISVPDAGHFPWFEAPGCVAAAMDRLAGSVG